MSNLLLKSIFIIYFRIKLAQTTNKCKDEELDYYVQECSDILGITGKIDNKNDAKAALSYVFKQLVLYYFNI